MKIYKSKKDNLIRILIIVFTLLPIFVFFIDIQNIIKNSIPLLVSFLPVLLLLWIYFDTYYIIDGRMLKYHSAFIKGEIEIIKIKEIVKEKTAWIGIKPSLARKGLIVKFNRFDEIYISPKSNETMISDLLEINPNINII
jgi:hypothetical protein